MIHPRPSNQSRLVKNLPCNISSPKTATMQMVGWVIIHRQASSAPHPPLNPHNYNWIYFSCVLLEDPENLALISFCEKNM